MGKVGHRLVIGPGGSGTTHRLNRAMAELGAERSSDVIELWGHPAVPVAPPVIERVRSATGSGGSLIVAHDVHWLPDEVIIELVHACDRVDVWASRRPWPIRDSVGALDDRLTADHRAERLGPLTVADLAAVIAQRTGRAVPAGVAEAFMQLGGGYIGPVCDALDEGWWPAVDGDGPALPIELVERLLRRIDRAGSAAAALARVLVIDPQIEDAIADRVVITLVDGARPGHGRRAAAAGGLLGATGALVPAFAEAVAHDLTDAETAELHQHLADVLVDIDRDRSIDHAVAGVGPARSGDRLGELLDAARAALATDPERASDLLDRCRAAGADDEQLARIEAELHLRNDRPEARAAIARLDAGTVISPEAERLRAAADLRSGRWDRVVSRRDVVAAPSAGLDVDPSVLRELDRLGRIAALLIAAPAGGEASEYRHEPTRPDDHGATDDPLIIALADALAGRTVDAVRRTVEAADDELTGGDDFVRSAALSAAFAGGLLALVLGESGTSEAILARSVAERRPVGELSAVRPLLRYVALRRARAAAVIPVGGAAGEVDESTSSVGWARDLLVGAAVEAAVARRTVDPVRLRSAWIAADAALVRAHPSWLFLEPIGELLVTGARLGHSDRIGPVMEVLTAQIGRCTAERGPLTSALAWLQLHLALAGDDPGEAVAAAAQLEAVSDGSAHSRARVIAGHAWARLAQGSVDEAEVTAAVDALLSVGEGWEAARLAGQAALDVSDPAATRRLLEQARAAAGDPLTAVDDTLDPLVMRGLSEREAEVARLVAEGQTYREIGAELYISAKTVEHHVARIRQKLGATSRAELLAAVRAETASRSGPSR